MKKCYFLFFLPKNFKASIPASPTANMIMIYETGFVGLIAMIGSCVCVLPAVDVQCIE
jgi:hypothetical protein